MRPTTFLNSGIYLLLAGLLVTALPFDDLSDIRGPYCENRGCCNGRVDTCDVSILGTQCYCDEFCNSTRVGDCCPDYWSFCKGIIVPTPPPPPPDTTKRPIEELTSCLYQDRTLFWKQKVKDNCNECICEKMGGNKVELICETNVCLIEPDLIDTINSDSQYGWTASNYSEFWGRTLNDGVLLRLGTIQPQRFVLKMNPVRRIYDPNALPKEFDSENKWPRYITGIQDQGWCGSSWAISTAAVASDRYSIVSKGFEKVQLSAQNLISCDTKGQQSCNGGHLDRAWSFIRKFGLVDEDCFPYEAKTDKCSIKRYGDLVSSGCKVPQFGDRKGRYTTGPAYRLGNETDIMYEITKSGPVQATIKVYHDFFTYKGGIYKHTDLTVNQKHGFHSVRIVGWGEERTYNGIQKYWKVANSWGPQWGENGYFRIAKGSDEVEIESFVIASWPRVNRKILLTSINAINDY